MLCPSREHGVDLRHHGGAFSHGGRNPFGRAGANIADREHARPRGLEQQGRAADRVDVVGEAVAGDDEALRIRCNAVLQPAGVWIGADEAWMAPLGR